MFRNIVTFVFFVLFALTVSAEVCFDWENTADAFEEAYAKWKAPSSYSFNIVAYTKEEHVWKKGVTVKRTVKPGQTSRKGPYRGLQTMDDVWKLIRTKCIKGCPEHGASFYCSIHYTTDKKTGLAYPSSVLIDPTSTLNETQLYEIDKFCVDAKKKN